MSRRTITLIKGDGIGPEITTAVQRIFRAAEVPIDWEEVPAGLACIEDRGTPLPAETMASIRKHQVALKGPTTTPIGSGHKSVNVSIRKGLDLFANVRPCMTLPGIKTRFENVNILIVRENIEDTYGGIEYMQTPDVAQCLKVITRPGSLATIRFAFETAKAQGRKRVTCLHKANIMKATDGLFLECFREVAQEYPEVPSDDLLVDAACMNLVIRPEHFDVLVTPNLYGDLISDLCAGLVGGLGVAPGGNIGHDRAVFEAVHGSAPDIAGKGMANPTAILLSSIQMLRYLGLLRDADRIEFALRQTLVSGIKTRDLGGSASTSEFTEAVCHSLPPARVHATEEPVRAEAPRIPSSPRPAATGRDWEPRGVDVYIQLPVLPELPEQVGPFKLRFISNRGTKIWPGPLPDILIVDWHRCRYLADGAVTDADILALLTEISSKFTWMHVEKLYHSDGVPQYAAPSA